jgi:hypothetical protein
LPSPDKICLSHSCAAFCNCSSLHTCSCGNGCKCGPKYLDGSLTYNQVVTFIDSITPTAAPACQINIALASNSTAGSKLRVTGMAVTSDPGSLNTARIGEEKYMAWLLGENWAA